jgi:cytidylate kinase
MKKLTIAIDGFSACGKSTIAKDLAKILNYVFIDSGAMYRGITYFALQNGWISEQHIDREKIIENLDSIRITFAILPDGKQHVLVNNQDVEVAIRSLEVSNFVSQVAAMSEVRKKLVALQREMGKSGGIVMDGRDIGSVVFPSADLKFFVNADLKIRALRRQDELAKKSEIHSLEEIMKNLQERDYLDSNRTDSPLIQTEDAIVIDTSEHTRASQLDFVLNIVRGN